MAQRHDYIALDWVHKELEETLKQAQLTLAAFEDDNSDVAQLQFCLTYLHQVRGTLDMIEVSGAGVLAAELEKLSAFLVSRPERATPDALSILLQGILQLPTYLERLLKGQLDQPMILAPLINDIRAQRDAPSIPTAQLFVPDLSPVQAQLSQPLRADQLSDDNVLMLQRLHQVYQWSLLNVLRQTQDHESLNYLPRVTERLAQLYEGSGLALFWQVASALLEAVAKGGQVLTPDLRRLMSRLDRIWRQQLRQIKRHQEPLVDQAELHQLLYFISQIDADIPSIRAVQLRYQLSESLVTDEQVQRGQDQLRGPDSLTLDSVAHVLVDELSTVKDQLDLIVRAQDRTPQQLLPLVPPLRQISDTMSLLQVHQARQVLDEQIALLLKLAQQPALADDELMNLAGGLLYVEASLSGLAQNEGDTRPNDSLRTTIDQAHVSLVREVRNSIESCKEAIVAYIGAQWDSSRLAPVPDLLQQIHANLALIPLSGAAAVVEGIQRYLEESLLNGRQRPDWEDMDRLADALMGVDYYLERLPREHSHGVNYNILERAVESLTTLGYPVALAEEEDLEGDTTPPADSAVHQVLDDYFAHVGELDEATIDAAIEAADELDTGSEFDHVDDLSDLPIDVDVSTHELATTEAKPELAAMDAQTAVAPLAEVAEAEHPTPGAPPVSASADTAEDDLIDDDIREIFLEEAGDVQAEIAEWFPKYCADPDDKAALLELRRAFHTLKGSGRMVRALTIGELGWSVEYMLNQRRDGLIEHSTALEQVVLDVSALLPELVADFAAGRASDEGPVTALQQRAAQIARGETPIEARQIEAAPEPEIDTEDIAAADAAPSEDSEADADAGERLFSIFSQEVRTHVRAIEDFIDHVHAEPDAQITDAIQRALHTIKGSSHMAGIDAMADIAAPLEQLVKALHVHRLPIQPKVVTALGRAVELINAQLNQLAVDQAASPAPDDFYDELKDINAWIADQAAELGNVPSSNLMSIFLNEAMNTVLEAEDTLKAWQDTGLEPHRVQTLQRDLTTLADAARAIDLLPLSSLSNQLVVLYEYLADHPPSNAQDPVFHALYEAHEAVIDMMDRLAAGQSIQTRHDIESELAEFAGAPLAGPRSAPSMPPARTPDEATPVPQATTSVKATPPSLDPQEAEWYSLKAMDADILDVFLEEASELLETIQQALDDWRNDPDSLTPVHHLQRDLHTLKGGARMAEAVPVGDLAHELEFLYEGLTNGQLESSEALLALIAQGQDKLADMVHDILERQGCMSAPELIQAIHAARINAKGATADLTDLATQRDDLDRTSLDRQAVLSRVELEALDADILEVFVDEAVELLSELDEAIAQWHADPTDELAADEMKRVLHTLKGGSRLARLPTLGVLSHDLESFIVAHQERRAPLDNAFFAHLLQQYDQLGIAVEQLQSIAQQAAGHAERRRTSTPKPNRSNTDDGEPADAKASAASDSLPQGSKQTPKKATKSPVTRASDANASATVVRRTPQETIKVPASLLENLVNLAGETSISRARLEEQVSDMGFTLNELDTTIDRLREKVRLLDMETEAQVIFRQERAEESNYEDFDPLEMDRYTQIQQLSRSLMETSSDLIDLRATLANKSRDAETVLLQQSRIHTELQEGLMQTRMVPFSRLVPRLRRIVRQVATELGKDAKFDVLNADGEMDRSVLERMVAPLEHMLRNAVDHGIEHPNDRTQAGKPVQGDITLSLTREGGDVVLALRDDGRGINVESVRKKAIEKGLLTAESNMPDEEVLQFILSSGFSTAEKVTQVSGRGVGMDVVHNEVKALGGTMEIQTAVGQGSQFLIRLPFTVSVNRALMVASGDDIYAIPLNTIDGIVRLQPEELRQYLNVAENPYPYGDKQYQVMPLGTLLGNDHEVHIDEILLPQPIILIKGGDRNRSVALHIDRLMGSREIVVKTLGPQFASVPAVSGATILGDGSVVVILDVPAMLRSNLSILLNKQDATPALPERHRDADSPIKVLVVDDSVTVRKVTSRLLSRHGMEVSTAKDGVDAMLILQDHIPDIILLDIEMPRMDGFEVANRVRHTERIQHIPIIMITSRTGQKHKDRAMEIGVDDYMGKPFQEAALMAAIDRLVNT